MIRADTHAANELSQAQQTGGDPAGKQDSAQRHEPNLQIGTDPGQPATGIGGQGAEVFQSKDPAAMQADARPQCSRLHARFGQHPADGEERGKFSEEKVHIAKAGGDLSEHEESAAPVDGGITDLPAFRRFEEMHQGEDEGQ